MPARGQPLRAAWPALTVRGVPARGPRKPVSRIAAPHKHFRPRRPPKEARVSSCCVVCLCLCARSTRRAAPAAAGVQGARCLAGSGAGFEEIWTRAEKEWVLVPTRHRLAFVRFVLYIHCFWHLGSTSDFPQELFWCTASCMTVMYTLLHGCLYCFSHPRFACPRAICVAGDALRRRVHMPGALCGLCRVRSFGGS